MKLSALEIDTIIDLNERKQANKLKSIIDNKQFNERYIERMSKFCAKHSVSKADYLNDYFQLPEPINLSQQWIHEVVRQLVLNDVFIQKEDWRVIHKVIYRLLVYPIDLLTNMFYFVSGARVGYDCVSAFDAELLEEGKKLAHFFEKGKALVKRREDKPTF
jgi:hypothetical protein